MSVDSDVCLAFARIAVRFPSGENALYPFDNPELARLAFHQAGHVVVAVASGIAVHSVTAVVIEEAPAGVKLAPLHEIVALAEADVAKIELVSRYVETRLAGADR